MSYLPKGLPEPVTETDKLDQPYWQGTRAGKLMVQRCGDVQHLAVGTGMDLPRMPLLGHEMG